MYNPQHFEETRVDVLHDLIRDQPFATMVTLTSGGLEANHIPFEILLEPKPFGTLRGHVARANPVWHTFSDEIETLVIFAGPHSYISPSWYPSKAETGMVVPTWNYAVVHAYGRLRAIEDRDWLRMFVERLTVRHEAARAQPWSVADAPREYIDKQLDAIVGIELTVTRLTGKWKTSQNREVRDREGVIEGLRHQGGESALAIARLIGRTMGE